MYYTRPPLNIVNIPQIYDSVYIVFDKHFTSKSLFGPLVISSIINYTTIIIIITVNINKTKFMVAKSNISLVSKLTYNNEVIEQVSSFKYFGH